MRTESKILLYLVQIWICLLLDLVRRVPVYFIEKISESVIRKKLIRRKLNVHSKIFVVFKKYIIYEWTYLKMRLLRRKGRRLEHFRRVSFYFIEKMSELRMEISNNMVKLIDD